ncbi:site-specific integrase [Larkinella ripae]
MVLNDVKVNFWLRRQRVAKRKGTHFGQAPVMFYIIANGVRSNDARTGVYCSADNWDAGSAPAEVTQRIRKLEEHIGQMNARYEQLNIPATGTMLLNDLLNTNKPARFLLIVAQEMLEALEKKVGRRITKVTFQHYKARFNNLTHYVELILKRNNLTLHEVNNAFVEDMEEYFRDRYITQRGNRKGMAVLTLKQQVMFLVNVMDFAQRRDYVQQNPIRVYKVDASDWKPNKTYLTDDELDRFRSASITDEKTRKAADVFLFLCETGMSYCDYLRMQDDWIKPLRDLDLPRDIRYKVNPDEKWLIGARQKSKVSFAVPLSLEAQRLLTLYGGVSGMPKKIDNNDLNIYIRSVAQLAGITKHLTSYVARKTFAHYWRNRSGLSSKAASRLMGHSTDTMINFYADVQVEAAVREVYARIA